MTPPRACARVTTWGRSTAREFIPSVTRRRHWQWRPGTPSSARWTRPGMVLSPRRFCLPPRFITRRIITSSIWRKTPMGIVAWVARECPARPVWRSPRTISSQRDNAERKKGRYDYLIPALFIRVSLPGVSRLYTVGAWLVVDGTCSFGDVHQRCPTGDKPLVGDVVTEG